MTKTGIFTRLLSLFRKRKTAGPRATAAKAAPASDSIKAARAAAKRARKAAQRTRRAR